MSSSILITYKSIKCQRYLHSREGREMTKIFTVSDDTDVQTERIVKICEMSQKNLSAGYDLGLCFRTYAAVSQSITDLVNNSDEWAEYDSIEFYEELIAQLQLYNIDEDGNLKKNEIVVPRGDYQGIAYATPYISLYMYTVFAEDPDDEDDFYSEDCYYPIMFNINFDVFARWCELLGIEVPPVPAADDMHGRCMYYLHLNACLEDFRDKIDVSRAELCALLYGYANDTVSREPVLPAGDLPSPFAP